MLVALPLLAVALIARCFRSDFEETAWRLMALAMLLAPIASLLPKTDVGFQVVPTAAPQSFDAPAALLVAYAVVALVLFARIAIAVVAAHTLRRNAQPFDGAYLSTSLRVPVTAGLTNPAILLPHDARTWSAEKLAAVLAHERAHVARRDPSWRFIGRLTAAVCWFNPLAWLAAASIERLAEEAADREAVAAVGDRHVYADVVLDILRTMTGTRRRVFASAMLDRRSVGGRINAILLPSRMRRSPFAARMLLAMLVFVAFFTTAMTKQDEPPPVARAVVQRHVNPEDRFRTRDELRTKFRERVRTTMRALFGGFVN
jgi:Zn-dependent protease with chaperone function